MKKPGFLDFLPCRGIRGHLIHLITHGMEGEVFLGSLRNDVRGIRKT